MNKELQDLAWSVLPKEFKEDVKKRYNDVLFTDYDSGYEDALTDFFGRHNLTSDAEGGDDEMLYVSRKQVQELYSSYCTERDEEEPGSNRSSLGGRIAMLQELFGSKCLPDEEPKPQPKFHKGDRVKVITDCWKDNVYTVTDVKEIYPQFSYKLSCSPDNWFAESTLELAKEPKLAEPTVFSIESDKVSVLNYALLKLEEASKAVREALTKIN